MSDRKGAGFRGGRGGQRGRGRGGGRGRGRSGFRAAGPEPESPPEHIKDFPKELPKSKEPLADQLTLKLQKLSLSSKLPYALRPGYGKDYIKAISVISNRFAMGVRPDSFLYHYDVRIEEVREPKPNRKKKSQGDAAAKLANEQKFPKNLAHRVMEAVKQQESVNGGLFTKEDGSPISIVFDRTNNLYASAPLKAITKITIELPNSEIETTADDSKSQFIGGKFIVDITETNSSAINLPDITRFYEGDLLECPERAIRALEIVLRQGPGQRSIVTNHAFFPINGKREQLGEGVEMMTGHFQAVRAGADGLQVVVDKKAGAFYPNVSLLNFIIKFHNNNPNALNEIFFKRKADDLEYVMKKLRFQTFYLGSKRTHKCQIGFSKKPMKEEQFVDENGEMVYLVDYYAKKYNIKLQEVNLPCINFGNKDRKRLIPLELVYLIENQRISGKLENNQTSNMIKFTASKPVDRFNRIFKEQKNMVDASSEWVQPGDQRKLENASNEWLDHDKLLIIDTQPKRVVGKIYATPTLQYNGSIKKPKVGTGSWVIDKDDTKLYRPITLNNWAIIAVNCGSSFGEDRLETFAKALVTQGEKHGLTIEMPHRNIVGNIDVRKEATKKRCDQLSQILKQAHEDGRQLVCFVGYSKDDLYGDIKYCGDRMGVVTQFVQTPNAKAMNAAALILKINAKLGGVNNIIATTDMPAVLKKKGVMIIGADVTHQAPIEMNRTDIRNEYSIASIVATIDNEYFKFTTSTKVQLRRREENITQLDEMLKEVVEEYKKFNKALPKHIIYYRDGVSDGQFAIVHDKEMTLIEKYFRGVLPTGAELPKITVIVVQKRHRTRFRPQFEKDGYGKAGNVPAGTVVDTTVTSRYGYDYFMVSHEGIQGTSRPIHYFVLRDDIGIGADELYKMTYYLTHTYAKCTRSISIPPAVQYAHLAAERARYYLLSNVGRPKFAKGKTSEEIQTETARHYTEMIKVHPSLKAKLYYC